MDMAKLRAVFIGESEGLLGRLEQALLTAEKNPKDSDALRTIFQVMHTLKGNAATMGFGRMAELAHRLEDVMEPIKDGKRDLTSEWVDFLLQSLDLLRALLRDFQEGKDGSNVDIQPALAKIKALLEGSKGGGAGPAPSAPVPKPGAPSTPPPPAKPAAPTLPPNGGPKPAQMAAPTTSVEAPKPAAGPVVRRDTEALQTTTVRVQLRHLDNMMNLVGELAITKSRLIQYAQELGVPALSSEMKFLERLSVQLQEEVLQTRMVPVDDIFQRYVRVVRDVSHELGKEVHFEIHDNGISVDRVLLEKINEPVVHLLRNCIDHGIESREGRIKAGKSPVGNLWLEARHEKNFAVIEVRDDGAGIDVERVKAKAQALGIISLERAQKMSHEEGLYLICHPNLSTKEEISRYSGRGVGMDVVHETMQSINGHLDIRSDPGKGARFSLFLPLNLAIIQALLFKVGHETYALPLGDVLEIVSLSIVTPKVVDRQEVISLRDEVLSLIRLNDVFHVDRTGRGYALVVQARNSRYALAVDSLVGRQEVVLKNLSGFLKQIRGVGGATILGDGRAVLILDVQGFI